MNKNEEKREVKVGIRYTLVYDGTRKSIRTRIFPYSEDVVIHDSAIVSVPANWNNYDICTKLFVTGKRLYYYDNSDHLICAGKIES